MQRRSMWSKTPPETRSSAKGSRSRGNVEPPLFVLGIPPADLIGGRFLIYPYLPSGHVRIGGISQGLFVRHAGPAF